MQSRASAPVVALCRTPTGSDPAAQDPLLALALLAPCSRSAGTTLRMVSAFAEKRVLRDHLQKWLKTFNAEGKGTLQINFIGGPKASDVRGRQRGEDRRRRPGHVDRAFYTNVMPEADFLKLTRFRSPTAQERAFAAINESGIRRPTWRTWADGREPAVPPVLNKRSRSPTDRHEDPHHAGLPRLLRLAEREQRDDAAG